MDTRWSCGLLSTGSAHTLGDARNSDCDAEFSLGYYRYVRQIKLGGSSCHTRTFIVVYEARRRCFMDYSFWFSGISEGHVL